MQLSVYILSRIHDKNIIMTKSASMARKFFFVCVGTCLFLFLICNQNGARLWEYKTFSEKKDGTGIEQNGYLYFYY